MCLPSKEEFGLKKVLRLGKTSFTDRFPRTGVSPGVKKTTPARDGTPENGRETVKTRQSSYTEAGREFRLDTYFGCSLFTERRRSIKSTLLKCNFIVGSRVFNSFVLLRMRYLETSPSFGT